MSQSEVHDSYYLLLKLYQVHSTPLGKVSSRSSIAPPTFHQQNRRFWNQISAASISWNTVPLATHTPRSSFDWTFLKQENTWWTDCFERIFPRVEQPWNARWIISLVSRGGYSRISLRLVIAWVVSTPLPFKGSRQYLDHGFLCSFPFPSMAKNRRKWRWRCPLTVNIGTTKTTLLLYRCAHSLCRAWYPT